MFANLEQAPDAFEAQFYRIWTYNDCEVMLAQARWRYRVATLAGRSLETALYVLFALRLLRLISLHLACCCGCNLPAGRWRRVLLRWLLEALRGPRRNGARNNAVDDAVHDGAIQGGQRRPGGEDRRLRPLPVWWLHMQRTFRHLPVLPVVLGAVVLELLTEPVEAHSGPSLCYGKAPPPPPSQPSFY